MPLDTQISVRIPDTLATKLEQAAKERGVDRSNVIREALRLYLEGTAEPDRPWHRIGDLAGAAKGGPPDLGARHREHLKRILLGS